MTYLEPNGPSATGLYMPIRMHWNLSLLKCFPPTVGYNTDNKIFDCTRANEIDAGVWTNPASPCHFISDNATNLVVLHSFVHCNYTISETMSLFACS